MEEGLEYLWSEYGGRGVAEEGVMELNVRCAVYGRVGLGNGGNKLLPLSTVSFACPPHFPRYFLCVLMCPRVL